MVRNVSRYVLVTSCIYICFRLLTLMLGDVEGVYNDGVLFSSVFGGLVLTWILKLREDRQHQ